MQDCASLQREVKRVFQVKGIQLYPDMNSRQTGFVQFCLLAILQQCWPDAFEKPQKNVASLLDSVSSKRREAFDLLCDVASKDWVEPPKMMHCEMSTCMVARGSTDELDQFSGLIEYVGDKLTFFHPIIRAFLAAIHYVRLPPMSAIRILTNQLFQLKHNTVCLSADVALTVLYFFGAASTGLSANASVSLRNLIGLLCLNIDGSQPVQDDFSVDVILLAMRCSFEAQDASLCKVIDKECLTSRTFVLSVCKLEAPVLSYYIYHTTHQEKYWTVYCSEASVVNELREGMKQLGGALIVKSHAILSPLHRNKLVFSTRTYQYLTMSLNTFETHKTTAEEGQVVVPILSFYGYQTEEQYKSKQQVETSTYFNFFKDMVLPHFQLHSPSRYVEGQYRKMDHLWFSLPRSMRHDFYKFVEIAPCVPTHWVKAKQPDGTSELELMYKTQADETKHLVTATPVAELVILNSQCPKVVRLQNPEENQTTVILLDCCSDTSDQGRIGCDFLKPEYEAKDVLTWIESRPFHIKRDVRVGKELPLPSKKADLGASTTMSGLDSVPEQPQAQPTARLPIRSKTRGTDGTPMQSAGVQFPRATGPYQEQARIEEAIVTEHAVKRMAMESFDHPGTCFFGDESLFISGTVYPLPDSLSSCRVLKEGGNGIVLEVKYNDELFAAKKTAFRWREVLIMTKLKHRNILKLIALIIGKPLESHSKRRYVYHIYPKLTNDLGRMVGSFEKYCLRTLKERYSSEKLLLKKVESNFCYVAHEILTALDYLHTRPLPILHRDVKASNILVKMVCDCYNPLVCVCRRRPDIVLSDFDASLELSKNGTIQPDPPRSALFGFHNPSSKVYHISAVGTVGYKSPEGSLYSIGNDLDAMPYLTTKADIFSFGVLMLLLFVNEDGPKHLQQMGKLLLSVNQTVGRTQKLSQERIKILRRSGVLPRQFQVYVSERDIDRVIPLTTVKREFSAASPIYGFLSKSLVIDPLQRSSAKELLQDNYLTGSSLMLY